MFIELIESLRCTRPHEDSWLVGSFEVIEGRDVREGRIGCPVCRAEYRVAEGIAWFDVEPGSAAPPLPDAPPVDADEAVRLAALLGLVGAGGMVVAAGAWGALVPLLQPLVPAQYVVVNGPSGTRLGEGGSLLRTARALPLAPGSARGVALDASSAWLMESAVRALAARGRLVAPADLPLPAGVTELARDSRHWVAERGALATPPVALTARRSPRPNPS